MTKLTRARKATSVRFTRPIVGLLARTPITPNLLTWLGFLITVGAAVLIATGHLFAAGWTMLVAGLFDMLDGALARTTGQVTRFGGILDSTLDRFSEAVVLVGLVAFYTLDKQLAGSVLAGAALTGSFLVSYIKARTEVLGIECNVGLFTRPERVVLLALGLLLSRFDFILLLALAVLTFFSFFTAGQRLYHAWRQTKGQPG